MAAVTDEVRRPALAGPAGLRTDLGLVAAILSAAAFGTSGPFAKSLINAGWTPGAVVLVRICLAAVVLVGPAVWACRGRWGVVRDNVRLIVFFGVTAVALPQLAFFQAVARLPVGVALLLEYSGTVLVVLFVWWRTRRAPSRTTTLGALVALAGLALVLNLVGAAPPDIVGVIWGLAAALGLAAYYVSAGTVDVRLPPIALAAFGMVVGGLALGLMGVLRVLPMTFATEPVVLGSATLPWWVPILELALVAAALAYLLGTYAVRQLGSTVSSFVGLSEVLFAIGFAWLLLGESLAAVQLVGAALVVAGVVAVRLGESRSPI